MKILFIPYGTERAAATRYRVAQYLPILRDKGINCVVFSAISGFSTALMIRSPEFGRVFRMAYYIYVYFERFLRFFYIAAVARRFDIIFLQRTTFPFRLELILKALNGRIIFDIDDAIYLTDSQEGGGVLTSVKKFIKEREVINILRVSKKVIVENDYIKNFVSGYCRDIVKIPGPIDTNRFFVSEKAGSKDVVIGWIGSPATTPYLHMLDGVFKALRSKYDFVRFSFIGAGKYDGQVSDFGRIAWKYETEVAELQKFDIGVMPMPDDEWTRGKLGCKMLQYMAVGIPAVVSYTPTNAEVIDDGANGFFARTEKDWIRILTRLIEDRKLGHDIGQKGRDTVVKRCSLPSGVDMMAMAFEDVIKGR